MPILGICKKMSEWVRGARVAGGRVGGLGWVKRAQTTVRAREGGSGGGSGVAASAGSGLVVSLLITPGAGLGGGGEEGALTAVAPVSAVPAAAMGSSATVSGPACGSSAMWLAACQGEGEGWGGVAGRFGSTLRRSGSPHTADWGSGGVRARCLLCDHLELLRRHVRHLLHEIAHHGLRWRLLHLDGEPVHSADVRRSYAQFRRRG